MTIPLASKQTLFGFLSLRYLKDTGARSTLEGDTFLATLSFPMPSIPLQWAGAVAIERPTCTIGLAGLTGRQKNVVYSLRPGR